MNMKVLSTTIILGIFGLTEVGCADTAQFTKTTFKSSKGIGRQKDTFYLQTNLVTTLRPTQNIRHLLLAKK